MLELLDNRRKDETMNTEAEYCETCGFEADDCMCEYCDTCDRPMDGCRCDNEER